MSKQCCDIVVVKHFSTIADESVDEIFRLTFVKDVRSKRTFSTNSNTITTFYIEGNNIDSAKVKKFEKFLESNGYTKLFSAIYLDSDVVKEIDARFFTFNLNPHHFSDIKDLLISKIEKALGKKLKVHEDIYYFSLTKSQMRSRLLVRYIDELYSFPAVENIICI